MSDEQRAEGREQVGAGEVIDAAPVKKSRVREERYGPDGRRIPGKRVTGKPELYKLSPDWQRGQAKKAAIAALDAGLIPGALPNLTTQQGGEIATVAANPANPSNVSEQSQFLARQGLNLAQVIEIAPDAVNLIGKIVRGKLKAPIGLRLQAAFKVLDAGGINAAVGERIEAALKQPGGASLQSLAARLIEASELAKKRSETGQKSGTDQSAQDVSPL